MVITLLAGVLLRVIYLAEYSQYINFDIAVGADVREYFERAMGIISGVIFPETPDIHGIFYPVVISPVLALTKSVVILRILQMILNVVSFAALYKLLGKYSVPAAVRRVFFVLAMCYTIPFFHTAELISETLLIPLITAMMYMLYFMRQNEKKSQVYAAFAGVFSGFAILTHGSMLLLSMLFTAEIFREKRRRCAMIFLLTFAAITGAVVLGKSLHYGKFTFVQANGGFNFYLGNSPEADGTCRLRPGMAWRRPHLAAEKEAEKRGISTDTLFIGKSLKYMANEPVRAVAGFFKKAALFFHYKELISGADSNGLLYRTYTVKAGSFLTLSVMLFAVAGVILTWKKREKVPADFVILFLAIFAVNVITVCSGRYRYTAYPSIYLFAAYAVAFIPKKVTAISAVIFAVPALLFSLENKIDFEAHRVLGQAAYQKGNFDAAFDHIMKIRQNNDDPSGVENILGDIYKRRNDINSAKECYRRAITLEPERHEAYMNLAELAATLQESDELYRKSLANGGNKSGLCHTNYAKFLIKVRRINEAREHALQGTHYLPQSADAWNTLAVSYAYSGNIRLAMESFETASNLAPENENYRRNAQTMKQELQRRHKFRMQQMRKSAR